MPEPAPEELERLHAEIAGLVQQANGIFDAVGLTDDEKAFARDAAQQIARHAIRLWTDLRHQTPKPQIRMIAVSAAVASALATVDANARATDAFSG